MLQRHTERIIRAGLALRRRPLWTLAVVLVTALAVGPLYGLAMIAAALLSPSPTIPSLDRIFSIVVTTDGPTSGELDLSGPELLRLREHAAVFETVAGWRITSQTSVIDGRPETVAVAAVTSGLLQAMIGVPPQGRLFAQSDFETGAEPALMVSWERWQRDAGGRDDLTDWRVDIDGRPHAVKGVLPAGFGLDSERPDYVIPTTAAPVFRRELVQGTWRPVVTVPSFRAVALVRPGVSAAAIDAELRRVKTDSARRAFSGRALVDHWSVRDRRLTRVALTALALFTVLALATVMHLVAAQVAKAWPRYAIASALGANRRDIHAEIISEAALIGLGSGAGAVLLAMLELRLTNVLFTSTHAIAVPTALSASAAIALLASTTVLVVLVTWMAALFRERQALGHGPHLAARPPALSTWARRVSLASQAAAAATLLTVFVVILAGNRTLLSQDFGLPLDSVFVVRVPLRATNGEHQPIERFFAPLLDQVRSIPGVRSASIVDALPLLEAASHIDVLVTGGEAGRVPAGFRVVSSDYALSLGQLGQPTAMLPPAARTVAVNQAFARRYLPPHAAVGATLNFFLTDWTVTNVMPNVAGDVRGKAAAPEVYLRMEDVVGLHRPVSTRWATTAALLVQADTIPPHLRAAVAEKIRALDSGVPPTDAATIAERLAATLTATNNLKWFFAGLGFTGLLFAAVTQASLTALLLRLRHEEVAVRLALGGTPVGMLGLLLREAIGTCILGGLLSLVMAGVVVRTLQEFDPLTPPLRILAWAAALALLTFATLAVAGPQAWRTARMAPALVLRRE